MKRYFYIFSSFVFWLSFSQVFANQSCATFEDSTIKVLALTKVKNGAVKYLVPGMEINYWMKEPKSFWDRQIGERGILKGFSGDSLIVDDKTIALSDIKRIKHGGKKFIRGSKKVMGVETLYLFILVVLGLFLFKEDQGWVWALGGIPAGIMTIILSLLLISPGKLGKKYRAEIIDAPFDRMQQVKKQAEEIKTRNDGLATFGVSFLLLLFSAVVVLLTLMAIFEAGY